MKTNTETELSKLAEAAPAMLAILKELNYAFYVDGTSKALKPIMAKTKDLIRLAEGRHQTCEEKIDLRYECPKMRRDLYNH